MPNVVTYVTDDMTRWGVGKGAPATAHEHDESHFALSERIRALEESPPVAVSISSITQSGSQLTFHMSDGGTFGPFAMPVAVFQERGAWRAGRDYQRLDTVRVGGQGRFLILKAHHSEAPFDPDRIVTGSPAYYLLSEDGIIFGDDIEESRDLASGDVARFKLITGGSAGDPVQINLIEESTDAPWNAGDQATFETHGASLEIVADTGVTLICSALPQSRTIDGSVMNLLYHGNDLWTLTGDLAIA